MSRKPTLCLQSVAVVAYLKSHGASTLPELLRRFSTETRGQFTKRLCNLMDGNWLDVDWTASGEMLWLVAPRARAAVPTLAQPDSAPLELVPPRRTNVMVGHYTRRPRVHRPARVHSTTSAAPAVACGVERDAGHAKHRIAPCR